MNHWADQLDALFGENVVRLPSHTTNRNKR
jgi:hypothetical protein